MTNPYYNNNFQGQAGQTARAAHVDSEFEAVGSAFDIAFDSDSRSLRGQVGESLDLLPTALARRGLFLRFNATTGQPELVQSGFTWRGDWANATLYTLGDIVRYGTYGSIYICVESHTSAGGVIDPTDFEVMIDLTGINIIRNEVKTSSFTAVVGGDYMVDSSSGNVTITLPSAPTINDAPINITHVGGSLASGQLITVARNGKPIMGLNEDLSVNTANASFSLMFCDNTKGWRLRVLA